MRWVRGGGALAFPLSAWSRVRHCFHLCDPRGGGGDTRDPTNKLHSSLSCFTTIWQWLTRSSIQDKQQARSHVVLDTVPPPHIQPPDRNTHSSLSGDPFFPSVSSTSPSSVTLALIFLVSLSLSLPSTFTDDPFLQLLLDLLGTEERGAKSRLAPQQTQTARPIHSEDTPRSIVSSRLVAVVGVAVHPSRLSLFVVVWRIPLALSATVLRGDHTYSSLVPPTRSHTLSTTSASVSRRFRHHRRKQEAQGKNVTNLGFFPLCFAFTTCTITYTIAPKPKLALLPLLVCLTTYPHRASLPCFEHLESHTA